MDNEEDNKIFYVRCYSFNDRNQLEQKMVAYGYITIEATGCQIAFEEKYCFNDFVYMVGSCGVPVKIVSHCRDPGIGLFP